MELGEREQGFIEANPSAAMITVGADGLAKAARVAIGLIDGRLWSSGTKDRTRTIRLQQDPRCTLYVHEARFSFLVLETTVKLLDGPTMADDTIRLFRVLQRRPSGPLNWFDGEQDEPDFRQTLVDEGRILYEFEVQRAYGMY